MHRFNDIFAQNFFMPNATQIQTCVQTAWSTIPGSSKKVYHLAFEIDILDDSLLGTKLGLFWAIPVEPFDSDSPRWEYCLVELELDGTMRQRFGLAENYFETDQNSLAIDGDNAVAFGDQYWDISTLF